MIFTIIRVGLKGKSFYNDPKNFAEGAVKETALSFLVLPIISALIFLALLFILSFTHLLGGPYWLAKVFFWVLIFGYTILAIPIYAFYRIVKGASRQAGSVTEKVFIKSEIKE
ncbi:MAG: hypothetical protein KBC17_02745 [Candidatus Pacebacteria bacterium]|nr:hypothetical protein [Candidatus Paceibacterota bacterium]